MIIRDLSIARRSDFLLEAHFSRGTTPVDISGWKFWFTAKRDLNDPDIGAVFQKVLSPTFGTSVSFELNENDTAVAGELFYDIKALSPAGFGAPIMGGALAITPVATLAAS
jgi:hypothetical protein